MGQDRDTQWGSDFAGADLAKIGNFTFKEFATQDELDIYLEHEDYGQTDDHEGVCFAFSMH